MNRLVRAELRRYRARSAIRWLSVATVAVALLTVLVAFLGSRPTPPAEVAAAETAFAQQQEWWQDEGFAQCEEDEERARESDPAVDFGCESGEPRLEHFLMPVPTLEGEDDTWPPTGVQTLTTQLPFLALAGLVIGITFVTAELSTGAIGLWLTFEPRRRRVYWSKVAAAAVAVVPLAAVAALVMVGGAWGAYAANDQLGPVTAQTWTDLAGLSARAVVATAGRCRPGDARPARRRRGRGGRGVARARAARRRCPGRSPALVPPHQPSRVGPGRVELLGHDVRDRCDGHDVRGGRTRRVHGAGRARRRRGHGPPGCARRRGVPPSRRVLRPAPACGPSGRGGPHAAPSGTDVGGAQHRSVSHPLRRPPRYVTSPKHARTVP